MKKLFAAVLVCFMLTLNSGLLAVAEQGVTSTGNCSAKVGETFTVDLNLSQNPGVIGLSVLAEYDSSVLELLSYKNGDVFDKVYVTSQDIKVNPYKVMWIYPLSSDITKTGRLISFTFKVKNSAKVGSSTVLKLYSDDSTNENFEIIDFGEANVTVNIVSKSQNTNNSGNVDVEIQGNASTSQTGVSSAAVNSANSASSKVSGTQSEKEDTQSGSTYSSDLSSSNKAESGGIPSTESEASNTDNGQKANSPWAVVGTAAGVVAVVAVITVVALILRKNKAKDTKESEE